MKLAARNLDAVPLIGRDFQMVTVLLDQLAVKRLPQVSTDDLMTVWADILNRAKMNTHHKIGRQDLSVREHMSRILKSLQERGRALFTELFPAEAGRPELVVTFLALLELTRERLIDLTQTEPFAPIHACLAHVDQ
jgi:segregation and condensation protein A